MHVFVQLIFSSWLICSFLASANKLKEDDVKDCRSVKETFQLEGINIPTPDAAIFDVDFGVCQASSTCCTRDALNQLADHTTDQFQKDVVDLSSSVRAVLSRKLKQFDNFFSQLIENAENKLDSMFKNTYGDLYFDNADVFVRLFDDLRAYYTGSHSTISDIFEKFFTEVMLKVYELIHQDYDLTDEYKHCITENMESIRPFASSSDHIVPQFHRSFTVTRTFVRSLKAGISLVRKASQLHASPHCKDRLLELRHCATCQGVMSSIPCPSLCERTMRSCFHGYHNLSTAWQKYTDGLFLLLDRLDSPINIEADLDTFNVKASEAVMTLQDNDVNIDDAVKRSCGPPHMKKLNSSLSFHTLKKSPPPMGISLPFQPYGDKKRKKSHHPRSRRSAPHTQSRDHQNKKQKRRGQKNKHKSLSALKPLKNSNFEQSSFNYRPPHGAHRSNAGQMNTAMGTNLKKLVTKMRGVLRRFNQHWSVLPDMICKQKTKRIDDVCWNGEAVVSVSVISESGEEKYSNASHVIHPSIIRHVTGLGDVTIQLKQAYHGIDPFAVSSDDEDESNSSGEGSGSDSNNLTMNQKNLDEVAPRHSSTYKHLISWSSTTCSTTFGHGTYFKESTFPSTTTTCAGVDCGGTSSLLSNLILLISSILFSLFILYQT